ncbi:MAG: hypothetical protein FD138_90 [Planctomycetota bacterium]|nr:MAG: hypothetical protein FD138_90 [Planctomycetota bacterium]
MRRWTMWGLEETGPQSPIRWGTIFNLDHDSEECREEQSFLSALWERAAAALVNSLCGQQISERRHENNSASRCDSATMSGSKSASLVTSGRAYAQATTSFDSVCTRTAIRR